jgi:hypothetical protein
MSIISVRCLERLLGALNIQQLKTEENQMKKLVHVEEVDGEGLEGLMGERVTFFCANYFYTGDLVGVNDTYVKLENGGQVLETGPFNDQVWKDYQPMPKPIYVMLSAVEAFTVLK